MEESDIRAQEEIRAALESHRVDELLYDLSQEVLLAQEVLFNGISLNDFTYTYGVASMLGSIASRLVDLKEGRLPVVPQ